VIQNLDYLTGEQKLAEALKQKENVEVILGSVIEKLLGDNEFKGITVKSNNGNTADLLLDGMFVAIGLIPQNEPFKNIVELNNWGYVNSGEECLTNAKGFFVAGDCRQKRIRQVATAVADGAVAALAACDFVDGK